MAISSRANVLLWCFHQQRLLFICPCWCFHPAKGSLSARVYRRALGLLLLDEGKTLEAVAATVKVVYLVCPIA